MTEERTYDENGQPDPPLPGDFDEESGVRLQFYCENCGVKCNWGDLLCDECADEYGYR